MHILICDDDIAFARRVADYVEVYFESREIQVQCTLCSSGKEALALPDLELYRLAFLDVDMPGINGIDLGRQLKQRYPEMTLVYVSAYLEFALQGYTVNAYRYVLKRDIAKQLPGCLDDIYSGMTDSRLTMTVHCNRETVEIPLDQIYYLESSLRQIDVYGDLAHKPICSFYSKIAELPPMLFQNGFLQVGRSDVVNMRYIRSIRNYKVEMRNGVELSVSRGKYQEIRSAFLEWKGQFGNEV